MSRRADSSISARAGALSVRVNTRLVTTSVVAPISCKRSGAMFTMPFESIGLAATLLVSIEAAAIAGAAVIDLSVPESVLAVDFMTGTKSIPQIGHLPLGSCERTKGCIVQV